MDDVDVVQRVVRSGGVPELGNGVAHPVRIGVSEQPSPFHLAGGFADGEEHDVVARPLEPGTQDVDHQLGPAVGVRRHGQRRRRDHPDPEGRFRHSRLLSLERLPTQLLRRPERWRHGPSSLTPQRASGLPAAARTLASHDRAGCGRTMDWWLRMTSGRSIVGRSWSIRSTPMRRRAWEAIMTLGDGRFGTRGLSEATGSPSWPATWAAGVYDGEGDPGTARGPAVGDHGSRTGRRLGRVGRARPPTRRRGEPIRSSHERSREWCRRASRRSYTPASWGSASSDPSTPS